MSIRSHTVGRSWSATLLAVLLLLLSAATAAGAEPISLEARALVGGRFESGGWLGLAVAVANDGAPVTGYVSADTTDGVARRLVELPAGARKQLTLYVRPEPFQRRVVVRFEADGTVLASAEVEVRVLESGATHVAVVGDGGGNLRPQLLARGQGGTPEPLALSASEIPERPEPLRGIEAIVWAADSSVLGEAQRRGLERWVASGGQLVVLGGPDWQARTAAFAHLLPVESLAAIDQVGTESLAAWLGTDTVGGGALTAASGALRPEALALVGLAETDGQPMLAVVPRGAGRVGFLAVDLATEPFRAWEGSSLLWSRLLPDSGVSGQFGPGFPIDEEAANAMTSALASLPSLDVPPAELLLAVIVGYILLIGPASYLVLRRIDRRELAWVTAPLLVVIFSACSYGIGSSMKGSQIILNEISLVRAAAGGTAASVQTYAGLFSPERATYDLTVDADALLAPLRTQMFEPVPTTSRSNYLTEQGEPAHLRGLEVSVFGFQALRADSVIAYEPSLEVDWRFGESAITGTVTNRGETTIEDVAVIGASGGEMVGNLEPGASEEFTFSLRNFQGSSASDQVYGFMNFDPSTGSVAQRQDMVRREVINALVGYGGWWPGKEGEFALGIDRGPFVIGWQPDGGPVGFEVDGELVQRYSQSVQVISGRPTLGPGEVRLEPSQLAVRVVSSEGQASTSDPFYIALGNGEVVFSITVPLEASAIQPTSVTILTGGDPSMVLSGQNMGMLLPPGYQLSAQDPRSGDWVALGDLSQESRFEIEDPGSVLDATGRILVRVTGTGIDPNFGQVGVYVGASIEGVVP